ncbi:MAG: penicillin acylase family protein [Alphaproteobacteria bacterium]|nr:penicillin acylase family protein [Alphaproteobacteria bacterium]
MVRVATWVLGALFCLVVVGLGAFLWLRSSLPDLDGTVSVTGLGGPAEIARDRHGVPIITAAGYDDAMFALGFVHAQDRLFQMDLQRRTAAGTLAELLGDRAVAFDRRLRPLGLAAAAQSSWDAQDAATVVAYTAYADGVNAFLAGHGGAWPLEYVLLRADPAPWHPIDSILVLKAMSLLLGTNLEREVLRLHLAARFTPGEIDDLLSGPGDLPPLDEFPIRPAATAGGTGAAEPGGSNGWVIAGSRTDTGKPILANDPHLGLGLPGIWYLARIETPDTRLVGATLPGLPALVIGHNGHVAWGFTNTYADTQDLFIERLNPDNPEEYFDPDRGWRAFESRPETIRVQGGEDIAVTVRATRHGPVVSDADPDLQALIGPGRVAALAWTALLPGDTTPSVAGHLAGVVDTARFIAAASRYLGPIQNMMVADEAGSIAVIAPGLVPLRAARDGRVPAPGWTRAGDWTGFLPVAGLPRIVDPPTGRIVTANDNWLPAGFLHLITHDWAPSFRARRIAGLLDAHPGWSLDSVTAMQRDRVSLAARELLPVLRSVTPRTEIGRRALGLLTSWDGAMEGELAQPLVFSAWLIEVSRRLIADELGPELAAGWAPDPAFLARALAGSPWCDDRTTALPEDCATIATEAFEAAMADLAARYGDDPAGWRWDRAHRAHHRHPILGRLPIIGDLFVVSQGIGGDRFTIDVSDLGGDPDDPFGSGFGAGFRGVYDLADLERSRFVIAVGQSGNPFSPHHTDLAAAWLGNELFTIPGVMPGEDWAHRLLLLPSPCEGATPC